MKCQFVRPIFEKNGFCIYVYHTEDSGVPQGARDGSFKGPGLLRRETICHPTS